MTEATVSGPLGATLTLEGYSVLIRPKSGESTSACAEADPPFALYEMVITYTTAFDGPHFDSVGAVESCIDGPAWPMTSGVIYEVLLPRPAGDGVLVMLSPGGGPHSLLFDFN